MFIQTSSFLGFRRSSKYASRLHYQKACKTDAILQVAPSSLKVELVQPLLDASVRIAQELKYKGLGTFEFLLNAHSNEWVFLEINPRLQVEHTVTGIASVRRSTCKFLSH